MALFTSEMPPDKEKAHRLPGRVLPLPTSWPPGQRFHSVKRLERSQLALLSPPPLLASTVWGGAASTLITPPEQAQSALPLDIGVRVSSGPWAQPPDAGKVKMQTEAQPLARPWP